MHAIFGEIFNFVFVDTNDFLLLADNNLNHIILCT